MKLKTKEDALVLQEAERQVKLAQAQLKILKSLLKVKPERRKTVLALAAQIVGVPVKVDVRLSE